MTAETGRWMWRGDRRSGRAGVSRRTAAAAVSTMFVGVMVAAFLPPAAFALAQDRDGLSYDLAGSRRAMARAAKKVGPLSDEVAGYWEKTPYSFAHPDDEPQFRQQPDGRGFLVRVMPYDIGGHMETVDGYAVVKEPDGWWRYAVRGEDGELSPTDAVVLHDQPNVAPGDARIRETIWVSEEDLPEMREQLRLYLAAKHQTMAAEAAAAGEPVVFKVPTLMFQVNNVPFQEDSTPEKFERLLSGTRTSPTGTVTEMYLEQSHGNMIVDFDVYGPYTESYSNTPATDCAYGTDGAPVTGDVLGIGGGGARGMAVEAVPQSDRDVDYGKYDNDLDGIVDFLLIIHSGPDAAATGDPCHVWSHYFPSIFGEPTIATSDENAEGEPVVVGPVMTVPEIDLHIGVVAHELMHALGEPDYYDTSGNTQGTGDWDLGAGGSWLGIPAQTNPIHFNPLMKVNFGWVEPVRIEKTALDRVLRPRASYPDLLMVPLTIAKKDTEEAELCDQSPVGVPNQNVEFYDKKGNCLVEGFLIEDLSRVSAESNFNSCLFMPADFDRQAYASGLAVWHWDFRSYSRGGNNDPLRYMLDLEEFDRRDDAQELQMGTTRADPLDLFWGDPVGISGATQVNPGIELGIPPPNESSSWTVRGAPSGGAEGLEARTTDEPQEEGLPTWTVPDVEIPTGTGVTVTLSWDVPTDDWDLYVDKFIPGEGEEEGEWEQVGSSAGGAPQTQERTTIFDFKPGDKLRVRAYNWAGPTSPQAEVSVQYTAAGVTQLGPAGSRDNDLNQTGWQITDIRPNAYSGVTHTAELPYRAMSVDLVKHTKNSVDVSPDFVSVKQTTPRPVVAGRQVTLETKVYNHGGRATTAAFSLYDGDPRRGGDRVASLRPKLKGYERKVLSFTYTPRAGLNELWTVADAPSDSVAGNNLVRSELFANRRGADVLVVDNDRHMTQEEDYASVLEGLRVPYHVVKGEPNARTLKSYDGVIWLTTTVSGAKGVMTPEAVDAITSYLDAGGRLWLSSARAMGYLGSSLDEAEFLAGYFGLVAENNLLNSPGAVRGLGDAIGGSRSIRIGYIDERPYVDYGRMPNEDDEEDGLAPKGAVTPLFTHSALPSPEEEGDDADRYLVGTKVRGSEAKFRTVFTSFTVGMMKSGPERARLGREILSFLQVPRGTAGRPGLSLHLNRFRHVQVGEPWRVVAGATARSGIDSVQLRYRPYGATQWRGLTLNSVGTGLYQGTIPGSAIGTNGLEYYARAVANNGATTTTAGGARLPDVASAPYGDKARAGYGACPEPAAAKPKRRAATKVKGARTRQPTAPAAAPPAAAPAESASAQGAATAMTGTDLLALVALAALLLGTGGLLVVRKKRSFWDIPPG